jgi:hypothetical protein
MSHTPRISSILMQIAGATVGIVCTLIMLALTPVFFLFVLVGAFWQDAIVPMVQRWRSRPATEEEIRRILEADRAKNPHTYHTPES